MVYGDNLKWYKLGKQSTQAFVEAARKVLGGGVVAERLASAAPYLCGEISDVDLSEYELHAIIEWLERPEGPPPSAGFTAYRKMLKQCRGVIDDSELEKLAGGDEDGLL